MSDADLTIELAVRVLGWRAGDGRFITSADRQWIPAHQFRPFEDIRDACKLLDRAGVDYAVARRAGAIVAEVTVGKRKARAAGPNLPRVLCMALARALGIEREGGG